MLPMSYTAVQQRLTLADKLLIGVLLLLSLGSYPLVRQINEAGESVQIEVDGKAYTSLSLRDDQTVLVPGPLGNTTVLVQKGETFVEDSPCRAKICIKTGHISQAGQMIVCVPNKVVIRVVGKQGQELPYDAISR